MTGSASNYDVQWHIGESRDSGSGAAHHPGMTPKPLSEEIRRKFAGNDPSARRHHWRSRAMPQDKTFTGGCHCGLVRFECTTDLAMVTACNCSICTKKGLHFAFLPPANFQLRAGEDNLKEYLFNKHAIRHQSCRDCGVEVFARGSKPDGTEVVALNVSCIDGIELAKLTMTPVDGRNR